MSTPLAWTFRCVYLGIPAFPLAGIALWVLSRRMRRRYGSAAAPGGGTAAWVGVLSTALVCLTPGIVPPPGVLLAPALFLLGVIDVIVLWLPVRMLWVPDMFKPAGRLKNREML